MEITHDRSYINRSALEFIARGYGAEDIHSLRFQFVYTEAEQARNAAQASTAQGRNIIQAAQEKNRVMKPVMRPLPPSLPAISIIPIWNMATTALTGTCSSGATG